uniref:Uncharacterized protein n=1 Tax=Candidatus Kentrum sp. TUN TaxID=2126343 RepID=A0A450ZWK6_9GAMM|nr:MAG: hypothetical protein BECKTUN1418F_GA0071002_11363 [Candidatus Kentron sp. TUN]VFK67124.1 MAG: hypothetical protein BECKTUN1418E_GA0071001_11333 [Candidatus Kentron sp. TUN]
MLALRAKAERGVETRYTDSPKFLFFRYLKSIKEITDGVLELPPEADEASNWRER